MARFANTPARDLAMTTAELKDARRALGWTQEQIGEALGVNGDQMRKWSGGVHRVHPSAAKLIRFYLEFPQCRPTLTIHRQRGGLKNC